MRRAESNLVEGAISTSLQPTCGTLGKPGPEETAQSCRPAGPRPRLRRCFEKELQAKANAEVGNTRFLDAAVERAVRALGQPLLPASNIPHPATIRLTS
jgi:hypothetical protein